MPGPAHTRRLTLHIDSLYLLLSRLEERKWIRGAWIDQLGERRAGR
jgi:hypothetical protein